MSPTHRRSLLLLLGLLPAVPAGAASVTGECELGTLGADWTVTADAGTSSITSAVNFTGSSSPGSASRVASINLSFPQAGEYDLYARIRVGPGAFDDDSFFVAGGFGERAPDSAAAGDWLRCNGLASSGYSGAADLVDGSGNQGSGVWKWVNLSRRTDGASDSPVSYTVAAGELSQTFQIGSREDGLEIDKLLFGLSQNRFTVAELDAGGPGTDPPPPPYPPNLVHGDLIQFNDNGAWCWYQDERVIYDPGRDRLVTGSVASGSGTGGGARDSDVEAVVFDLATRVPVRSFMHSYPYTDDHNAPAFLRWPDGRVLAQFAGHNNDFLSRFRTLDGDSWSAQTNFDWTTAGASGSEQTSYSNPYYLSAEGRAYTFVRCIDNRSPHFLNSDDMGATWTYGGQLVEPDGAVGYNSGYFRYCGNGTDRIDFICTEGHPRDLQTSIYHGYIQAGRSHRTDGTVVDADIFDDGFVPVSSDFTRVVAHGVEMPPGKTNTRFWNSDVQRYADGSIQAIVHARNDGAEGGDSGINPNHSFFFCRYDGSSWTTTYLCQAGTKMYSSEADYVGLGALSPNDPDTIFLSTRYDPRVVVPGEPDNSLPASPKREIWKGVTDDGGATFRWTPLTENSSRDNFRPVVPAWDGDNVALIWFRGIYNAAQDYDAALIGLVERRSEGRGRMSYVDAGPANTTLSDGSPLVTGDGIGQWHQLVGTGNGGVLLASADLLAEDAPMLRTLVEVPAPGSYDLWVNFWGDGRDGDWRIAAGPDAGRMQVFRQMACASVDAADHSSGILTSDGGDRFLFQGYLGRMTAGEDRRIEVFIDDHPIVTGTSDTLGGDESRTWFDGVSYARVAGPTEFKILDSGRSGPESVKLTWTSLPPDSLLAAETYTVHRSPDLEDWSAIASDIPSAGGTTSFTDGSAAGDTLFYKISKP